MQSLILPFGDTGWEEKKRILEDLFASRHQPPFIYNDVLILVPSTRLKRLYGRWFIDAHQRIHGASALVPPEVLTLYQLLQQQYARLGGPRLIDETSRLVLLEGLVKDRLAGNRLFKQRPELLAPSLSSALAKMIEHLSSASVRSDVLERTVQGTDLEAKPQVRLLLDVYGRYETALGEAGLADPAGMLTRLYERFDPAWLARYRKIILDAIVPGSPLEAGILKKIADSRDCLFFVAAPSQDLVQQAGGSHPLRTIRELVSSHCPAPPEQRGQATVSDRYLSSALFSERPFSETARLAPDPSSFLKEITVLSAVTMREEVSLIARTVKRSLQAGTAPDSVLVAFPALDEYAPLVEEIFGDFGIPYNRALGRQLGTSPVTASVIALLRAQQEDFSGPSLLRIFSSPFLQWASNPAAGAALDRLLRERKITGGRQRLLSALAHSGSPENRGVLSDPLRDLFAALDPFSSSEAAPLPDWMDRLSVLMERAGIDARVALIKGPLNINVQALKKLKESVSSLADAGRNFPGYRYTLDEWLFLLRKTFMHARFQVPPEDEGGVQILGVEESQGHPWKEIYLGGLTDAKFPQRLPQNIFLPEQTLEAVGVRTLERARLNAAYHFYRLLLSADRIFLTCPENEGDRPVVPSPFLKELEPLRTAGLLNRGIGATSGIQFGFTIEDSYGIPDLGKAIALSGSAPVSERVLAADIGGMAGIRSALQHGTSRRVDPVSPVSKDRFSVTELDRYLNCPYDYYISGILGIEPVEEVSDDLSPLDRGSKVHAILRNFYHAWNGPVTRDTIEEAAALLQRLANASFDPEPDTFRNRREKNRFVSVMAPRFLDAEVRFWRQGMKPAYLEHKIAAFPLSLPDGSHVELSAKIDRIDADENGNFMIVDYKTGRYPLPVMNADQKIFQLPVYAAMAQALSKAGDLGYTHLRNPIGLVYYDLGGKTGAGARDVVLFNREAGGDHPSSKPKASPKSAEEFEAILKRSMDKARSAIEGIRAGNFPSNPQDGSMCRYCANAVMCGEENKDRL